MHRIFAIFRKELRDTLRDRRTLIMMIVLPLVLIPLIMTLMASFQARQQQEAQQRTLRVAVVEPAAEDGLADYLSIRPDVEVVTGLHPDSARAYVRRDSLDGAFLLDDGFAERVASGAAGRLEFVFESGSEDVTVRRLRNAVERYGDRLLAQRLDAMGLDTDVLETIDVAEVDVATQRERIGRLVGGFLPYIFLIFCYLGAMYPAIDLAAGEKERQTMETLLTSPATRMEILVGKFGVVVLAGMVSAIVSLVGLVVGLQQGADLPPALIETVQSVLTPRAIALELALLLPLTMFLAAILLTVSIFAKSFKEAQSMLSPLSILVIIPASLGMLPGVELTAATALVPVLNVSLATKEIIAGTIDPGLLALVFASLIALAAGALWLCTWYFRREKVIFRT